MSIELLALICFSLGVGVWLLIDHAGVKQIAKFVGGVGGVVYGVVLLLS